MQDDAAHPWHGVVANTKTVDDILAADAALIRVYTEAGGSACSNIGSRVVVGYQAKDTGVGDVGSAEAA